MSANEQNEVQAEAPAQAKPLTQAERAKQLLAQKKQGQNGAAGQKHQTTATQAMKSQNTKKVNNQRKKMGV
ncbi:hypothetical protein EV294_111107 [Paenibacillus sp. BK033]|uniref:hypothetical protein n=1 Tax=Paenibacillus sp. BK033 TaxID=2512133 RepID=UPI00104792E9|nr:hypothetical protein [Paenibacillus sp. BK033]TCM89817.1 hypothetical protein EV294_111107 [Paenibacillus sp. BK033]